MSKRMRLAGVAALVCMATACPRRTAVWVEEGSTVSNLRLRVAERRGGTGHVDIGILRVDRCGAWVGASTAPTPMWGVASNDIDTITVFNYGSMPAGFSPLMGQADTALTLVPGCYDVTTGGTGRTTFDVLADGGIVERTQ